jgi:hypothetical protein
MVLNPKVPWYLTFHFTPITAQEEVAPATRLNTVKGRWLSANQNKSPA